MLNVSVKETGWEQNNRDSFAINKNREITMIFLFIFGVEVRRDWCSRGFELYTRIFGNHGSS